MSGDRAENARRGSRLPYQPALDGIRAIAVIAVLFFHGGFSWMSGGYLGVSVFFTLSGFLITTLLIDEHERAGRVDIVGFYSRRIRRLVPASAVCLSLVVVAGAAGWFDAVKDLRRDVGAAVLQVANWGQLTSGRSYADLFLTGVSPIAHYWSLAIEEQFYFIWPLAFVALAALARRSRPRLIIIAAVIFAVFAAMPVLIAHRWGADATYFATPARADELFAGVLLALVIFGRRLHHAWQWVALPALIAIVAACVLTPAGHGWAYSGGLPLFAVVSALLIVGVQVSGPVRSALSWRPLVLVGTISYGIYLFHWPIFVLIDAHGPSWPQWPLFALKVTLTFAVAIASFRLVERPIRRGRSLRRYDLVGALAATAMLFIAVVLVTDGPQQFVPKIDAGRGGAVAIQPVEPSLSASTTSGTETTAAASTADSTPGSAAGSAGPTPATAPPTTAAPRPLRVLVVGDSTALSIGSGLVDWAYNDERDAVQVSVTARGGCGFVLGGQFGNFLDIVRDQCDEQATQLIPDAMRTLQPDVVVVSITLADTWERSWDGGKTFLKAVDPEYADKIASSYAQFFQTAIDAGVRHVVWLRPPLSDVQLVDHNEIDPSFSDGSQALVENVVRDAAAKYPDVVQVVDLRSWLEGSGILDDPASRPDDIHLTEAASTTVAREWLGQQLMTIAES